MSAPGLFPDRKSPAGTEPAVKARRATPTRYWREKVEYVIFIGSPIAQTKDEAINASLNTTPPLNRRSQLRCSSPSKHLHFIYIDIRRTISIGQTGNETRRRPAFSGGGDLYVTIGICRGSNSQTACGTLRCRSRRAWPKLTMIAISDARPTSEIGTKRTSQPASRMSAFGGKAEVVIASPDFRV